MAKYNTHKYIHVDTIQAYWLYRQPSLDDRCNAPLPMKGMADVIIMSATAVAQYQQKSKTCHPESTVKRKIYINRDSITLKCTDNIIHRIISTTDTSTS